MKKALHNTIQAISGILAFSLLANLIVHIPFYIIDGNMLKLFSPVWMYLDGVTLMLSLVFFYTMRREKMLRH